MKYSMFNIIYLSSIIMLILIRLRYVRRHIKKQIELTHESKIDIMLIRLPGIGMFALPLIYLFTDWFEWAEYQLPEISQWAGVVLFIAAILMLWRSHAELGKHWTPALQVTTDHQLVTTGIYRRIRHPMYSAHWLWAIAQAALLPNWIAGWSMFILFLPGYFYRISREEKMLRAHFGAEYERYMQRSGRLFPLCK